MQSQPVSRCCPKIDLDDPEVVREVLAAANLRDWLWNGEGAQVYAVVDARSGKMIEAKFKFTNSPSHQAHLTAVNRTRSWRAATTRSPIEAASSGTPLNEAFTTLTLTNDGEGLRVAGGQTLNEHATAVIDSALTTSVTALTAGRGPQVADSQL